MAVARTRTLLSLDQFAELARINPLHFNQVVLEQSAQTGQQALSPATVCGSPYVQNGWMESGRIGREEIAQAISQAEQAIMDWTGYALAPMWAYGELIEVPRPNDALLWGGSGRTLRGAHQTVKAGNGFVIACGAERKDLLGSAAVTWIDTDGDNYFDSAQFAVATSVTDPEEIAIYYSGQSADDAFEIRPITVSISGGVATITCRRDQLVKLTILEAFNPQGVDGLEDANFVSSVDVYRHWTDPSLQATYLWDGLGCLTCGSVGCTACTGVSGGGCLGISNARLGFLSYSPGTWDAASNSWMAGNWAGCRQPDRMVAYYKHGWRGSEVSNVATPTKRQVGRVAVEWALPIAHFALALLDRPLCDCETLRSFNNYWQEDIALRTSGNGSSSSFALGARTVECPFGTTRGAMDAWAMITRNKIGE